MTLPKWHVVSPLAAAAGAAMSGPSACVAGGGASDETAVAIARLPSLDIDLLMDLTYRRAATQELSISTAVATSLLATDSLLETMRRRHSSQTETRGPPLDTALGSSCATEVGTVHLQPLVLLHVDASRVGLLLQLSSEMGTVFEPIAALLSPPPGVEMDYRSILQFECARLEASFHPEDCLMVGGLDEDRLKEGVQVAPLHPGVRAHRLTGNIFKEGLLADSKEFFLPTFLHFEGGCSPLNDEVILLKLAKISFCLRNDRDPSLSLSIGHLALAGSASAPVAIIASTDTPEWSRAFLVLPEDDTPSHTGSGRRDLSFVPPPQQPSLALSLNNGGSDDGGVPLLTVTLRPLRMVLDAHTLHALQRQVGEWAHARWMAAMAAPLTSAPAPSPSAPASRSRQQPSQSLNNPVTPTAIGTAESSVCASPRKLLQLQLAPLPLELWMLIEPQSRTSAALLGMCSRATLSLSLLTLPRQHQLAIEMYHVATTIGTSLGGGCRGFGGQSLDGASDVTASSSGDAEHTEPLIEQLHAVLHMMLPRSAFIGDGGSDGTASAIRPCTPLGPLPGFEKGLLTSGVGLSAEEALDADAEWIELELLSSLRLHATAVQLHLILRLLDGFACFARAVPSTSVVSASSPAAAARPPPRVRALAAAALVRRATVELRAPHGVEIRLTAVSGADPLSVALLKLSALSISACKQPPPNCHPPIAPSNCPSVFPTIGCSPPPSPS